VKGVLPEGAAPVDRSSLRPCNSYSPPDFIERGYYLDYPFTCVGCGSEEVWTASQQKWWYEVAKGSLDSGANRCRACRRALRRDKGKAHPLQRHGHWLARIRDDLGPALLAAGWTPAAGEGEFRYFAQSFRRGDVLAQFRWGVISLREAFLLERRAGVGAPFQTLVHAEHRPFASSHEELERRYNDFQSAARRALGLETIPDAPV
jgi:hypothetical protein